MKIGIPRNQLAGILTLNLLSFGWSAVEQDDGKWCVGFGCNKDNLNEVFSQSQDDGEDPCSGFDCSQKIVSRTTTEDDKATILTAPRTDSEECLPTTLEMTTPQDISFTLKCDDALIWSYPLDSTNKDGGIFSLSTCISPTACCEFEIQDKSDPESTSIKDLGGAHLLLQKNKKALFNYNVNKRLPFDSFLKVFGSCDAKKEETEEAEAKEEDAATYDLAVPVECTDEETPVHFAITLDANPEQQSWYLVCDAGSAEGLVTLMDAPRGSLTTPNALIEQEACVSAKSECVFTIADSQGDGMATGGYSLTFGNQMVGNYDSSSKEAFGDMNYCIGYACENTEHVTVSKKDGEASEKGFKDSTYEQEDDSETRSIILVVFACVITLCSSAAFILFCLRRATTSAAPVGEKAGDGQDSDDWTVSSDDDVDVEMHV